MAKLTPIQIEQIRQLLNKFDAQLTRAFLSGIKKLKTELDFDQMAAYISEGRIDLALGMVSPYNVNSAFDEYGEKLGDIYVLGGKFNATLVPSVPTLSNGLHVQVRFDVANPKLMDAFQDYVTNFKAKLSNELQANVRGIITNQISGGQNPAVAARTITTELKDSFGLTPFQERAVLNYKNMLSNPKLTLTDKNEILSRALADGRFDRSVISAFQNQNAIPQATIDKMVQRYRERYLRYRATTIARTDSIRMLNMSNQQVWKDMIDEGLVDEKDVRKYWMTANDERVRDSHVEAELLSNSNGGYPINQPFKTGLGELMYPGDPEGLPADVCNCRCAVYYEA
jgi:hypothetical protein